MASGSRVRPQSSRPHIRDQAISASTDDVLESLDRQYLNSVSPNVQKLLRRQSPGFPKPQPQIKSNVLNSDSPNNPASPLRVRRGWETPENKGILKFLELYYEDDYQISDEDEQSSVSMNEKIESAPASSGLDISPHQILNLARQLQSAPRTIAPPPRDDSISDLANESENPKLPDTSTYDSQFRWAANHNQQVPSPARSSNDPLRDNGCECTEDAKLAVSLLSPPSALRPQKPKSPRRATSFRRRSISKHVIAGMSALPTDSDAFWAHESSFLALPGKAPVPHDEARMSPDEALSAISQAIFPIPNDLSVSTAVRTALHDPDIPSPQTAPSPPQEVACSREPKDAPREAIADLQLRGQPPHRRSDSDIANPSDGSVLPGSQGSTAALATAACIQEADHHKARISPPLIPRTLLRLEATGGEGQGLGQSVCGGSANFDLGGGFGATLAGGKSTSVNSIQSARKGQAGGPAREPGPTKQDPTTEAVPAYRAAPGHARGEEGSRGESLQFESSGRAATSGRERPASAVRKDGLQLPTVRAGVLSQQLTSINQKVTKKITTIQSAGEAPSGEAKGTCQNLGLVGTSVVPAAAEHPRLYSSKQGGDEGTASGEERATLHTKASEVCSIQLESDSVAAMLLPATTTEVLSQSGDAQSLTRIKAPSGSDDITGSAGKCAARQLTREAELAATKRAETPAKVVGAAEAGSRSAGIGEFGGICRSDGPVGTGANSSSSPTPKWIAHIPGHVQTGFTWNAVDSHDTVVPTEVCSSFSEEDEIRGSNPTILSEHSCEGVGEGGDTIRMPKEGTFPMMTLNSGAAYAGAESLLHNHDVFCYSGDSVPSLLRSQPGRNQSTIFVCKMDQNQATSMIQESLDLGVIDGNRGFSVDSPASVEQLELHQGLYPKEPALTHAVDEQLLQSGQNNQKQATLSTCDCIEKNLDELLETNPCVELGFSTKTEITDDPASIMGSPDETMTKSSELTSFAPAVSESVTVEHDQIAKITPEGIFISYEWQSQRENHLSKLGRLVEKDGCAMAHSNVNARHDDMVSGSVLKDAAPGLSALSPARPGST